MYIPYPQFKYRLSLFYLNLCLLSHLCHLHPTSSPFVHLLRYRTVSIVGAASKLKPKSVQTPPSPINTDITGHHRHHRSKSNPCSGKILPVYSNSYSIDTMTHSTLTSLRASRQSSRQPSEPPISARLSPVPEPSPSRIPESIIDHDKAINLMPPGRQQGSPPNNSSDSSSNAS